MHRSLIRRLAIGHAGIAVVIILSTATALVSLRGAIRQSEHVAELDRRLALLDHLRSDARAIARSARRYLLTGDLKEQQRVLAIENEMDGERKQLGSIGRSLDEAFDDYVSAIVGIMSADRTNQGVALATFEDELAGIRNALGDTFDVVVSRQRSERDAAHSSQRLARGAQWALLIAGTLGLLLLASGVLAVRRIVRNQSSRVRDAELGAERVAAARRELLASSKQLRAPLERILTEAAHLRMSTREEHQLELLQSITTAASQVDYMLRELLDVSAIQAGTISLRRERSDVATLVDRAIRQHRDKAHQRGIRLRHEVTTSLSVHVDRERIVRALASFIAMTISRARMGTEIVVSASPCDDGVRFVIQDLAARVPLSSTFEGASPTAQPADDLALHVTQRVIEAHGGRLAADNIETGRCFAFTLPNEPTLLR